MNPGNRNARSRIERVDRDGEGSVTWKPQDPFRCIKDKPCIKIRFTSILYHNETSRECDYSNYV